MSSHVRIEGCKLVQVKKKNQNIEMDVKAIALCYVVFNVQKLDSHSNQILDCFYTTIH